MQEKDLFAELSSIRNLMERSSKFISLSGLSGLIAGLYALAGAGIGYWIMNSFAAAHTRAHLMSGISLVRPLCFTALAVLVLSIVTSYWLTSRKAKKSNENVWNPVSRRMLEAIAVPMITGGLFIGILLMQGEYTLIAPACLIFYGLALVTGSHYTFHELKGLGICEILLGLLAMILPEYGLILWAMGFGLLHIFYGTFMHVKYER
jgi:hypothetical protein